MSFLNPHLDKIYALLRIMAGLLFLQHGLQKLTSMFGGPFASNPLLYAAGGIELIGGALIALGLFAGYAAFICSGTMAVAYFMHAFGVGDFLNNPSFFPIVNGGELAALYCFVFLLVAAKGSGIWSVDVLRAGDAGGEGGSSYPSSSGG